MSELTEDFPSLFPERALASRGSHSLGAPSTLWAASGHTEGLMQGSLGLGRLPGPGLTLGQSSEQLTSAPHTRAQWAAASCGRVGGAGP